MYKHEKNRSSYGRRHRQTDGRTDLWTDKQIYTWCLLFLATCQYICWYNTTTTKERKSELAKCSLRLLQSELMPNRLVPNTLHTLSLVSLIVHRTSLLILVSHMLAPTHKRSCRPLGSRQCRVCV